MKRNHQFSIAALALAVLCASGLVGCRTTAPASQQIDESAITAKIKAKLISDTQVAAHNIDVDTLGCEVTLSGEVKEAVAKSEAEKLAKDTEGVCKVVNRIKVVGS